MILGLSHITLMVSNLLKSKELFCGVLGAKEVYDSEDDTFSISRETFLLLGGQWICLMEGDALPEQSYNHIAFRINEEDLAGYQKRLTDAGVIIKEGRPRVSGEGQSLYFYDDDNHLFELHTGTLYQRLQRYAMSK